MTHSEYNLLKVKIEDFSRHNEAIEAYQRDLVALDRLSEKGFVLHFVGVTSMMSLTIEDCREIKAAIAELFKRRIEEHQDQIAAIRTCN